MGGSGTLISIYPEDLTFLFELDKRCYCNLKVVNNSEHHAAFKAQKECPPNMQCKDKFLIQSTKLVATSTDMDEIPPNTFNKEVDKVIEEMKLKVVYTVPSGSFDDSSITSLGSMSFKLGSDDLTVGPVHLRTLYCSWLPPCRWISKYCFLYSKIAIQFLEIKGWIFTLNKAKGVAMGASGTLISIYPEDLTFLFELDKPCYCNLKVVNNSEHHVAFKVKTTSPRKYFVRPNASIVQPWDSCTITITLQAQKEYPPDMQCKDKFLIQSTKVAASTDMDEIPPNTFNKEVDKVIEEMKLKVVYTVPSGSSDDSGITSLGSRSFKLGSDDLTMLKNASIEEIQTIQRLKDERDTTLQQNQQMQRELDVIRRRRSRKSDAGFSLTFAAFAGLIGVLIGLLMSLIFPPPQAAA
uniref:MSP domain-containing protein n=1 Tax=Oryza glumipatula TaxID=40148 RepID=A0A0E0BDF8_9ORYZ